MPMAMLASLIPVRTPRSPCDFTGSLICYNKFDKTTCVGGVGALALRKMASARDEARMDASSRSAGVSRALENVNKHLHFPTNYYDDADVHERMNNWHNVCIARGKICFENSSHRENNSARSPVGNALIEDIRKLTGRLNEALVELPAPINAAIDVETLSVMQKLDSMYTKRLGKRSPLTLDVKKWLQQRKDN